MIRNASLAQLWEAVSQHVKLNQHGFGLCPFHREKTGSFAVFIAKKGKKKGRAIFFCQGCKATGDYREWLQRVEGLDDPLALPAIPKVTLTPEEEEELARAAAFDLYWYEVVIKDFPDIEDDAKLIIEVDFSEAFRRWWARRIQQGPSTWYDRESTLTLERYERGPSA